jgi:serine/threonine protein kinase
MRMLQPTAACRPGVCCAALTIRSVSPTRTPRMPLAPGTRLGPYEIAAPLGAGGMGEVYKGRDMRLDHSVALKVLVPELAADNAA